ncbi:hypothetical protein Pelo_17608 [Pelomyxa schiedti]|nr:hypothetical protein Pelo_17608 [Pelomyxa schiedti]
MPRPRHTPQQQPRPPHIPQPRGHHLAPLSPRNTAERPIGPVNGGADPDAATGSAAAPAAPTDNNTADSNGAAIQTDVNMPGVPPSPPLQHDQQQEQVQPYPHPQPQQQQQHQLPPDTAKTEAEMAQRLCAMAKKTYEKHQDPYYNIFGEYRLVSPEYLDSCVILPTGLTVREQLLALCFLERCSAPWLAPHIPWFIRRLHEHLVTTQLLVKIMLRPENSPLTTNPEDCIWISFLVSPQTLGVMGTPTLQVRHHDGAWADQWTYLYDKTTPEGQWQLWENHATASEKLIWPTEVHSKMGSFRCHGWCVSDAWVAGIVSKETDYNKPLMILLKPMAGCTVTGEIILLSLGEGYSATTLRISSLPIFNPADQNQIIVCVSPIGEPDEEEEEEVSQEQYLMVIDTKSSFTSQRLIFTCCIVFPSSSPLLLPSLLYNGIFVIDIVRNRSYYDAEGDIQVWPEWHTWRVDSQEGTINSIAVADHPMSSAWISGSRFAICHKKPRTAWEVWNLNSPPRNTTAQEFTRRLSTLPGVAEVSALLKGCLMFRSHGNTVDVYGGRPAVFVMSISIGCCWGEQISIEDAYFF